MTTRCLPLLAAVSLLCWGLPPASASTGGAKPSTSSAKHKTKKHKTKKAKHKSAKKADQSGPLHGVVPPAQSAIFGVLKGPAVTALPAAVVKGLSAKSYGPFGLDGTQARQISDAPIPFYLVPGKAGICLFLGDGASVCTAAVQQVAVEGLGLQLPNATTNPDGTVNPFGRVVAVGVVPDGVAAVTATSDAGHTFTANTDNNGYVFTTDGPFTTLTFTPSPTS